MSTSVASFPEWAQVLFKPQRYKVAYGGRGSSKSWSFARALILQSIRYPLRILCTRELQTSIAESVHRLLSDQIEEMGLNHLFEIQNNAIYRQPYEKELQQGITTGSVFFFYGLKSNVTKVKSTEGINIVWVEEAEKVSENSWEVLIPTIREPGSEIWITFNPDEENDPTFQRFVVHPPPNCVSIPVNWIDNPWFPEDLRFEKDYLYKVDPEAAHHVWEGQCRKNLSSQIFRGKYSVEAFAPPHPHDCDAAHPMWDGPYYGADWGFANDPTVLMKLWIDTKQNNLMIEKEAYKVGLELDDTAAFFKREIPECVDRTIRADSARPETISYLARTGNLRIEAAEKWKGSVEDGIAYLKKFNKIIIHPRCEHQKMEAQHYSYKVDRLTRDVLAEVVDKNNHCWDADRYGLGPMIQGGGLSVWLRL